MADLCLITEPDGFSHTAQTLLLRYFQLRMGADLSAGDAADVRAIFCRLGRFWDSVALDTFPNLRWLCSPTTGLNHIDLAACAVRGVKVLSLKGEQAFLRENITSTAEFTWALMLSVWRNILPATESVRSGAWEREAFRSLQLKGRRLGLIGMGRVGQQLNGYAHAFAMQVRYFDPEVQDLPGRIASLNALLCASDIVIVCCAHNESSHHLISHEALDAVGPDTLIVNTARGEIVDEAAVVAAVTAERVFYATDVIADETNSDRPLRHDMIALANKTPRLVITPHIAGATMDAMQLTELHVAMLLEKELIC